jgi:hypothetical protein
MARLVRFRTSLLREIDESRILGIRAGSEHRFIGIWVVVVGDRVFVRTWNNKGTGWYHAFCENSQGAIRIGKRTLVVRARKVRGERILDSIDRAYAQKYNTKASLKYVRGLALKRRRTTTLELMPDWF